MHLSPISLCGSALVSLAIFLLLHRLMRSRTPWWLAATALIAGGVVTHVLTAVFNRGFSPAVSAAERTGSVALFELASAFLHAGISEELARFAVLMALLLWFPRTRTPGAAATLAAGIGLGFAAIENALASLSTPTIAGMAARLTPTVSHAASGVIMGYFAGRATAAVPWRWGLLAMSLGVVAILHGTYDFCVSLDVPEIDQIENPNDLTPQQWRALGKGALVMLTGLGVWLGEFVWACLLIQRIRRRQAVAAAG